jgi:serine/threonine protein kinase
VYFLLEYAAGGELFERLRKADKLSNDVAKFYGAEVLVAVDHVHRMGYMYRDLKPENVLLDETGHIKLTDFGFAKLPEDNGRCYTRLGTPQYLSPEMLEIKCKEGYTMAVDWWAWACMIFEFLTARTPFWRDHRDTRHEIYLRALRGKANWNTSMPKVAKGLLKQMLRPDLRKRLHAVEDVKKHEWFKGVDWEAVNSKKMRVPFMPTIAGTGDTGNFKHNDDQDDKPRRTDPVDQSLFAGF